MNVGGVNPADSRQVLKTRMALVGYNCMVSRLPDGISVGSGSQKLSNLCDEDITNYYALPSTANVTLLAGSPIVGVKDMKHYFDKDTKAGFKISVESSALKLSLLENGYHIRFYRDGKILKDSPIEQPSYSVLDLTVGSIGLGSILDVVAKEQPTEDFDEIALVGQSGIKVDAIKGLKVYYAFVGNGEYSLTKTRIKEYNSNFNTNIQLTPTSSDALANNLTDDDTSNGSVLAAVVSFGAGWAQVMANENNSTTGETFPEGTEAGFVYTMGSLLKVAETPVITLLKKNGEVAYRAALSTSVLSLDLGAKQRKISIKAPCAFSGIKIEVEGLKVLVASTAQYAFVIPKPITAGHQCTMSPTATLDICSCEEKYELNWDKKNYPKASWEMVSSTDNNVTFDAANYTLDFSKSKAYLEGNGAKATVVMKLTNTDGCSQQITINYGGNNQPVEKKEMALVNTCLLYTSDAADEL